MQKKPSQKEIYMSTPYLEEATMRKYFSDPSVEVLREYPIKNLLVLYVPVVEYGDLLTAR
jgi:hypothetical protein